MDVDKVLHLLKEYERSFDGMPDMTGLDWAWEHGWIEQDEWQSADQKANKMLARREQLAGEILEYRFSCQQAFDTWMTGLVAQRLAKLGKEERAGLQGDLQAFLQGRLKGLQLHFLISQVLMASKGY